MFSSACLRPQKELQIQIRNNWREMSSSCTTAHRILQKSTNPESSSSHRGIENGKTVLNRKRLFIIMSKELHLAGHVWAHKHCGPVLFSHVHLSGDGSKTWKDSGCTRGLHFLKHRRVAANWSNADARKATLLAGGAPR